MLKVKWTCLLLAPLTLAACQTAVPPVEVTRFHIGDQTARGTIAVEPLTLNDDTSIEYRSYAAAVGQELQRVGASGAAVWTTERLSP